MTDPIATEGERVTDKDGNIVCYVARDINRHGPVTLADFRDWTIKTPSPHSTVGDTPGFRDLGNARTQMCIEGEWRP